MADNSLGDGAASPSRPILRPFSGRPTAHAQQRPVVTAMPGRLPLRAAVATTANRAPLAVSTPPAAATELSDGVACEDAVPIPPDDMESSAVADGLANGALQTDAGGEIAFAPPPVAPSALDVSSLFTAYGDSDVAGVIDVAAGEGPSASSEFEATVRSEGDDSESRGTDALDATHVDALDATHVEVSWEQPTAPAASEDVDGGPEAGDGRFRDQVTPLVAPLDAPPDPSLDAPVAPVFFGEGDGSEGSTEASDATDATDWWGASQEPLIGEASDPPDPELAHYLSAANADGSQLAIDEEWLGGSTGEVPAAETPPRVEGAVGARASGAAVAETLEGIAHRVRRGEIVVAADASASPEAVLASVLASLLTTGS